MERKNNNHSKGFAMTYTLRQEENAYFTHQPALLKALEISTGPVLELGCGDGSTELLHRYCKKHNRELISVESDYAWMSPYIAKFHSPHHKFRYTNDWAAISDEMAGRQWGLVFIDQNSWNERTYSFKRLRDSADYLVLHDCDYFPTNGLLGKEISPLIGEGNIGERNWDSDIRYWKEFHPLKFLCFTGKVYTGPPTLIASNRHPCQEIEVDFTLKTADI